MPSERTGKIKENYDWKVRTFNFLFIFIYYYYCYYYYFINNNNNLLNSSQIEN